MQAIKANQFPCKEQQGNITHDMLLCLSRCPSYSTSQNVFTVITFFLVCLQVHKELLLQKANLHGSRFLSEQLDGIGLDHLLPFTLKRLQTLLHLLVLDQTLSQTVHKGFDKASATRGGRLA